MYVRKVRVVVWLERKRWKKKTFLSEVIYTTKWILIYFQANSRLVFYCHECREVSKGWVARERAKKKSIKRIIFTNLESCVFLTFTTSFSFFFVVVRTCTLSLQLTFYLSCKYYVVIFYASLFFVFFSKQMVTSRGVFMIYSSFMIWFVCSVVFIIV